MSIISTILSPITGIINSVIDKTVTDKNQAQEIKANISMAMMAESAALIEAAQNTIVAEAQGGFLQRNWRPVMMLVFVGLLVCKWMGLTDHSVTAENEAQLMDIIKIGLGGYVVGRSAEKIATVWRKGDGN